MNGHHGVSTNIRALRISAALILIYFVFEIAIALSTGSLALLADAGHELSTFLAISVTLIAMQLATRRPTAQKTFGLLRVEILAALFNGVLLLAMAGFIIVRGIERLQNPMEVRSLPMFIMAVGGIGLEIASLSIMYKGQKESLNIRGSFWEIYVADAWAGILFAVILTWAAYGIVKDSFMILVDATPRGIDLVQVERELLAIPSVVSAHHFHARTIAGHIKTFNGHLVVKDLGDAESVLRKAKQILDEKYKFSLSTIQIENEGLAEADARELEYRESDGGYTAS